jgi:hypothetical protein
MKNLHQEHFEDYCLTGDFSVFEFDEVSLKIDGSPALVFGTNPTNNQFFISTKSAFNKVKIKLCHSHEEIDVYFDGEVANILHACFDVLPRTEDIIQCDFIGFGGSDTYKPNTITYVFPEIITQKVIVAPHTKYHTKTEVKNAIISGAAPFFNDTTEVKFVQPIVDYIKPRFPVIDTEGIRFLMVKEASEAKKSINSLIRSGEELTWSVLSEILDKKLAHLYLTMIEIKEDLMECMIVSNSPSAFIEDLPIIGEGFVLKNQNMMIKLVNRSVFSYHNFQKHS